MSKRPTVLMILDGYGLNDRKDGNAIAQAKTPVMDELMATCPFVKGNASGLAVGLPDGQMGNSEVGHLNMGAGRIVYQELTRITKEIQDGDFFKNEALLHAVRNAKENGSALHMFGLLSDGGVHSHNTHLYGLLELAKREGLDKVYVHCFLDGRDICNGVKIRADVAEETLVMLVRNQAELMLEAKNLAVKASAGKINRVQLETRKKSVELEIRKLEKDKIDLYESYRDKRTEKKSFIEGKKVLDAKKEELQALLEEINREFEGSETEETLEKLDVITRYAGLQSYDKEVMAFLIEKAEVFSEDTIQVTWKHQNIYDKVFSITR